MHVAQTMLAAIFEVGLPTVVHRPTSTFADNTEGIHAHCAAALVREVNGQQDGTHDMDPAERAVDPRSGFIVMRNRLLRQSLLDLSLQGFQRCGSAVHYVVEGTLIHASAEEIGCHLPDTTCRYHLLDGPVQH